MPGQQRKLRTVSCSALVMATLFTVWPVDAEPVPVVAPYLPDSGSLLLRCGRLIDGVSSVVHEDVDVHIRDGRVHSLDAHRAAGGAPAVDLSGYTCLPGLIDMHTHISDRTGEFADLSVYHQRTVDQQAALGMKHAQTTLLAGFTTVRDVGTYVGWSDRAVRDAINRGDVAGPRMQISGFYLTIPGGGGDIVVPGIPEENIPSYERLGVARGPAAFAVAAQRAVDGGADLLKVIASGAVLAYGGVPGEPEMTSEEIAAVVNVAHAAGLRVAAHAHGARSIREAILAGADTIEHASLIDNEGIALAREHDVALSMDVYNGDYIDSEGTRQHWPEEFLRKNRETTEAQRQSFSRAHAAGVAIVFGTDAAVCPHGDNARQFAIMVERGMTAMEAIQAATSVAAKYMGWAEEVGSLTPGHFGDLIAVRGDPLQDIRVLQNVAWVIKGGLVFKKPGS